MPSLPPPFCEGFAFFVATTVSAGSPQRQLKSLRGSLLIVNASSADNARLHVQIAVTTVSTLHEKPPLK